MKNKLFILTTAVISLMMVSCESYLDRQPLDANSDLSNWSSEAALETFAWDFYDLFGGLSYGSGWTRGQYHAEGICDDYVAETFEQFTQNIPVSSGAWSNPYEYIRRANVLINRIELVPDLSEEAANHWRGVARFFRALEHFELVKTYGDIVWIDTEVDIDDVEALSQGRESRVTVMEKVCADLQFAAANLRSKGDAAANTVNKDVANALLSRVALYEAAWEKYHAVAGGKPDTFYQIAMDAAAAVMASGNYSITDDYHAIYTSDDLTSNPEVLLCNIYLIGAVNKGHATFGWSNSSTPTWGMSKSAIDNFTDANGVPVHMNPSYNDETLEAVTANRDARLAQIIDTERLMVFGFSWTEGIVSTSGYWFNKYVPVDRADDIKGEGSWKAPSNATDGPIFTYAEVLLNYAEAAAELGKLDQTAADKSINLIRENHGKIKPLTISGSSVSVDGTTITADPKNTTGLSNLIWEVRRERRSELMGDGFRYEDLMRWKLGKNLDFSNNADGFLGASKSAIKANFEALNTDATLTWDGVETSNFWVDGYKSQYNTATVNRKWDDKYYLEPIPSGQIKLCPALGQNPGW